MKRLYRSRKDKILGGVCGGLGNYFDIDPVICRLVWVLFVFLWGIGILVYIIAWIVIPLESGSHSRMQQMSAKAKRTKKKKR